MKNRPLIIIEPQAHKKLNPSLPPDVCPNKPFEEHMRHKWNEWMVNGEKQLTNSGNLKRPKLATFCVWTL